MGVVSVQRLLGLPTAMDDPMIEPLGFAVWDVPSDDWKVVLFMVDCEHVDSDGWHNNGSVLPCHCDERFQVRNPAIEWQLQFTNEPANSRPLLWRIAVDDKRIHPDLLQRWVAVGVKGDWAERETNE